MCKQYTSMCTLVECWFLFFGALNWASWESAMIARDDNVLTNDEVRLS
jgi:hypothetical protein